MEAMFAALGGEVSHIALAMHSGLQLLIWSVIAELGQPLIRVVLSVLPFWRNFENLKTGSGKLVWDYIPASTAVALWRATAALACLCGHWQGVPQLFRVGLTIEISYRLNDFVLGALGVRRYSGKPWQVRGVLMLYNSFSILLAVPAAVSYSDDPDVRLLVVLLIGSGAALAAVVPLQYIFNPMTLGGCKALLGLQVVNLMIFLWCRFIVSIYTRNSIHTRVLSMLYARDPTRAYVFAAGIFGVSYGFSGIIAVLLFQRIRKARHAGTKVKHLLKYFQQNKKDNGKENQAYIWSSVKFTDFLIGMPADMMSTGPWCGMRSKGFKKA
mmetsp:Transcript_38196/g.122834  ORF Transcript_38196/g.122834 Transcript_38196/m.122834 type:complete len:326 (-) Transcript_38196:187-1164(-)